MLNMIERKTSLILLPFGSNSGPILTNTSS